MRLMRWRALFSSPYRAAWAALRAAYVADPPASRADAYRQAGTYTHPPFGSTLNTHFGVRWPASVCQ
jgi:hypothetical protein